MSLPPLESLNTPQPLLAFLSLLLEPSVSLSLLLAPLHTSIQLSPPTTHAEVVTRAQEISEKVWNFEEKATFIGGHPRIGEGEVLSELSKKEQSADGGKTSEETLERLRSLNNTYEKVFPTLRFITFVNGRTRAAIVPEMEAIIGEGFIRDVGSNEWKVEVQRAVDDVWKIALARLKGLSAAP